MLSCDDGNLTTCNVSDPVQDLEWIRNEIDEIEQKKDTDPFYQYRYFAKGYHEGKPVFFQSVCCPPCSSVPIVTLKDCQGHELLTTYDTSNGRIKFKKTIWRAEGFPCD